MLDSFKTLIVTNDGTGEVHKARLLHTDYQPQDPFIGLCSWVAKLEKVTQTGDRDDCIIFINPFDGMAYEAGTISTYTVRNGEFTWMGRQVDA